jgi:hypothetical protein
LFSKNELASCEVFYRLRKKNGHLYRKDVFTVKILVKAVVISFPVFE